MLGELFEEVTERTMCPGIKDRIAPKGEWQKYQEALRRGDREVAAEAFSDTEDLGVG